MNVTDVETPRCVTGIPAYAGAATPAVMPGTTSNSIPAAESAIASSPPRPKTIGSPPLSRTTRFPSRASCSSSAVIASCSIEGAPPRFPTKIFSASLVRPSHASSTSVGFTSAS